MSEPPEDPFRTDDKPATLGQHLDALGIRANLEDGDLLVGAVVLLKVIDTDGDVALYHRTATGIGWIEKIGMLRAAEQLSIANVSD